MFTSTLKFYLYILFISISISISISPLAEPFRSLKAAESQVAAASGCTLFQIAAALYRSDEAPERPSRVEGAMSLPCVQPTTQTKKCTCMCIYIYTYIYTHISLMCIYLCMYILADMYTCLCLPLSLSLSICLSVCLSIYLCIYLPFDVWSVTNGCPLFVPLVVSLKYGPVVGFQSKTPEYSGSRIHGHCRWLLYRVGLPT